MECILAIRSSCLRDVNPSIEGIFESQSSHLVEKKVQDSFYSILTGTCIPESRIESWENLLDMNVDEDSPRGNELGRNSYEKFQMYRYVITHKKFRGNDLMKYFLCVIMYRYI